MLIVYQHFFLFVVIWSYITLFTSPLDLIWRRRDVSPRLFCRMFNLIKIGCWKRGNSTNFPWENSTYFANYKKIFKKVVTNPLYLLIIIIIYLLEIFGRNRMETNKLYTGFAIILATIAFVLIFGGILMYFDLFHF